jgi:AcrR family transcriptional regulator
MTDAGRAGRTPVRPRRGRPRDPDADERILAAAVELMLEQGVDATTVDEVATRAGVGKATVYRRWASKEELALDALSRVIDVEVPVPDTGSLRGDLEQIYRAAVEFLASPAGRGLVHVGAAEAARDERIAAVYRRGVQRRFAEAQPVFDRAVERGELARDADRRTILEWLPGLLVFRVLTGQALPTAADVPRLVEITLSGAGKR